MRLLPQTLSLVAQTRAALLEGIRARRWVGVLPGERLLSRELQVSRWTVSAAVRSLARDGLVAVQHGCRCAIRPRALGAAGRRPARPATVALLTPQPLAHLRQFDALWVDELRRILHEMNAGLSIVDTTGKLPTRPERALRQAVEASPHDAWVLLLSARATQLWFARERLPAIIAGSCGEDVVLPAVDVDYRAAGVHAGHVLLGAGHRRIAYLVPPNPTGGVVAAEQGLRAALGSAPGRPAELTVLQAETCTAIGRVLERNFGAEAPTAIVCAKAGAALTTFAHLAARGLRVPRDVSLVSMEAEPFFQHLTPSLAHYALSPALYGQRVARLICQQFAAALPPQRSLLQLGYVAGASIAKLHRRALPSLRGGA